MARNISNIHDFIRFIERKERGSFTTDAQIDMILNSGQLDAVEEWFKPYGENQELHDALRPLRVYQPFTSDASGFVTFPSNYIHLLGNPFTVAGSSVNPIRMMNEDELPFALTSQLRAITNAYPAAVDTSTGFSIYPQSTQIGFYWYLRLPAVPVFGYTQVGRTITYDPTTSTQIEFSDVFINHIIALALRHLGINLDDDKIEQYSQVFSEQTKV